MNIDELEGVELDEEVRKITKYPMCLPVSSWWAGGGPIIEKHKISIVRQTPADEHHEERWWAFFSDSQGVYTDALGSTPLVAAMRCFVKIHKNKEK